MPLLTAEEEIAIAQQVRRGDRYARRRLIEDNLRLVAYAARRHRHLGLSLEDLRQEGAVGLIRAVDRFDPSRNVRFSTFAYWWVRKAIIEALENQRLLIRLPAHAVRATLLAEQVSARLRQEVCAEPSLDDVAAELEIDSETLTLLLRRAHLAVTELSAWASDEPSSSEPGDDPLHEVVAERWRAEAMGRLLARLTSWDRELLELRFGLQGGREYSCAEIARMTGVTRQAVSQRVKSALRRLAGVDGLEAVRDG